MISAVSLHVIWTPTLCFFIDFYFELFRLYLDKTTKKERGGVTCSEGPHVRINNVFFFFLSDILNAKNNDNAYNTEVLCE